MDLILRNGHIDAQNEPDKSTVDIGIQAGTIL